MSLRRDWIKRLSAAQLDSSWSAKVEARLLRFLLSCYNGTGEEAPLPNSPLFEGDLPYGRTHFPLSSLQMRNRLSRVARAKREADEQPATVWEEIVARQSNALSEISHNEIERRRRKRERGYH